MDEDTTNYNRIGILIGSPGLGDLLTSIPFFYTLRDSFPEASLYFIGKPKDYTIPIFETYLPYLKNLEYTHSNKVQDVLKAAIQVFRLRDHNIDVILDTQRYFLHSFLMLFSGAKIRIGYSSKGIFSARFPGVLSAITYPVSPCRIILLRSPTSVATTGVPQARDSRATRPKLS